MQVPNSEILTDGFEALKSGDLDSAERIFASIVQSNSKNAQAWGVLSIIATMKGMADVGLERAKIAHNADRKNPTYLNAMGVAYGELGELNNARLALERSIKLLPTYVEAHYNLGKVLFKMERYDTSELSYSRAYNLDPRYPGVAFNLGYCKRVLRKYDAARIYFEKCLEINPADEDAKIQLSELNGVNLSDDDYEEHLKSEILINTGLPALHERLALFYLRRGDFDKGWFQYQYRTGLARSVLDRRFSVPLEPLPSQLIGVRVLVKSEQGLGDIVFFSRFMRYLVERGAVVSFAVPSKLMSVLKRWQCDINLVDLASLGESKVDCELSVWLGDLPYLLGAVGVTPSIEFAADELLVDRWRRKLQEIGPGPYLGLTWRSGTDARRSREFDVLVDPNRAFSKRVPLGSFAKAVSEWPGTYVSIQRRPYDEEVLELEQRLKSPIIDCSSVNDDLSEAVALLQCLDEYVCVSNTNLHLRTCLGLGGRVLLAEDEFRWMEHVQVSPWFPLWGIYRKNLKDTDVWGESVDRLRRDLLGSTVTLRK